MQALAQIHKTRTKCDDLVAYLRSELGHSDPNDQERLRTLESALEQLSSIHRNLTKVYDRAIYLTTEVSVRTMEHGDSLPHFAFIDETFSNLLGIATTCDEMVDEIRTYIIKL